MLNLALMTVLCAQPTPLAVSAQTSNFGVRKWVDGKEQFHDGIDLEAPKGTPITSIHGGRVIFAGLNKNGGKVVVIRAQTPSKVKTTVLYGHLDEILVTKGQVVKVGHLVGKVGSTGNSTGPHLHLSVWRDNLEDKVYKNVNPETHFKFCKYRIRKHPHY